MAVAFAHGVKQQVGITCYEAATPTAPAAPTIEVSVDGGAFAAADNAAAYDAGTAPDGYVVQGACVFVTLSATEMTSAVVVVRVTDGNLTEAQYGGPYYPGGHYTAARGDALDNLDAAVSSVGSSGTGARTVPFTLSDGAGTLAGSLKVHVEDGSGNLVAGPLTTSSAGVVTFYLDDNAEGETYSLVSASTSVWQGNTEAVEITSASEAGVAVTLTAQSLPVPSAADKYTVIIDAADEYGDLVGASAWSIKILNVLPRGLSTANLVQLTEQNAITTDANGRATFEISQETTSLTVSITPKLASGASGDTLTFTVEVSADDADDAGIIYFADLLHR